MKVDKSNFGWIFACCGLLVLLGISLFFGISGWFINTDMTYTTDLELGKTVQIDIGKNEANGVSLSLDGSFLEGQSLPQIILIKGVQNDEKLYLRAKIFIYTSENETKNLDIVQTINWTYNEEDKYFYLNGLLSPSDKISLCSHIVLTDGLNLKTGTKYIVTIIVQSLSESENVNNIWGIDPLENVWQ